MQNDYFWGLHYDSWLNGSTSFLIASAVIALPIALGFRKNKKWHAYGLFIIIFAEVVFAMAFQMTEIGPRRMIQTIGASLIAIGTLVLACMYYYLAHQRGKSNGR